MRASIHTGTITIILLIYSLTTFSQSKVDRAFNNYKTSESASLDLSKARLKTIPIPVFELKDIAVLDLRKNKLETLPIEIEKLKKLNALDLSSNRLRSIPSAICQLKNLNHLVLGNNPISVLPSCIGELKMLRMLDVWGTEILWLPESLQKIEGLTIDLQGVSMNKGRQKELTETFPNVTFKLSAPCDCPD